MSLYQCARCIFTNQSGKPTSSPLVIQAFAILAVTSILSVGISLADTWLHAATSAVLYSPVVWATDDALSASAAAYGTTFNTTFCGPDPSPHSFTDFCGQTSSTLWAEDTSILLRGYAAAGNQSTKHLITTLNSDDSMAIVTRPDVPQNVTYSAQSLGLTASCSSLASACMINPSNLTRQIDCSNLGLEGDTFPNNSNNIQLWKSGIRLTQGGTLYPEQKNSSTFNALVALYYYSPNTDISLGPSPNDAIISNIYTSSGVPYLLLANCSFTAYDVDIQVSSGGQTALVAKSNASDETTGRLWPGLLYQIITNALIVNTQSIVLTSASGEEVMADLSQEIGRLALGTIAGILVPIAPQTVGFRNSRLVSAYPFAPLALFLGLLFVYSAIAIALFVWCASVSSSAVQIRGPGKKLRTVALTQLVHMRLTNPLSFVASVFDPCLSLEKDSIDSSKAILSLQTDTQKLFDESDDTVRIRVGFAADEKVPRFEIRQRRNKQGCTSEQPI